MSTEAQLYVGPVAIFDKIPKTFFVESQESHYEPSCTNQACVKYNNRAHFVKYCDACGSLINNVLVLVENEYVKFSDDLLKGTGFLDTFIILNQDDGFRKSVSEDGFLDERIVVGANDDDQLSDEEGEISNHSEVLFYYTIDEMSDTMRRFTDKYVKLLDEYVHLIGPYKIVWSANIANS